MIVIYMLLALMLAALVTFAAKGRGLWLELQELRGIVAELEDQPSIPAVVIQPDNTPLLESVALTGAGAALAKPPTDFRLVMAAIKSKPPQPFRIPLGWYAATQGGWLQTAMLQSDVNHILITGQSDSGKDNSALGMLLALAQQYSSHRVQFAILDGKGADWDCWDNKAHTWLLAAEPEVISDAMQKLTDERRRRRKVLKAANVGKWDSYEGDDLPLLVVYVSELLQLQTAVGKNDLTTWLETELSTARAYGIRYIISTQTASNFSTQWRSQISLFMAGYQPFPSQDAPNVGISTNDIETIGAIPPSKIPAPGTGAAGVFCLVHGATALNVRCTYINEKQRDHWLAQLPNKPLQVEQETIIAQDAVSANVKPDEVLQAGLVLASSTNDVEASYSASESQNRTSVELSETRRTSTDSRSSDVITTSYVELPLSADVVPFEEQRRILETALTVKSKRQLSLKLYQTDGGQKSTWVKLVCDAVGLLQSPGASA
jgi:hypothetical protein